MQITLTLSVLLLFYVRLIQASLNEGFPPPPPNGISDPSGILTRSQRQTLAERLEALDVSLTIKDSRTPVQIVVALVDRMEREPDMDEDKAAEQLARALHDTWGVGQSTELGGTGVLIFLSMYDRVVYISRGGALDRLLTNGRIDTILYDIRPTMRQAQFAEGLLLAIDEVIAYIEKGEPTWREKVLDLFQLPNLFLLIWLGALVHGLTSAHRQRREQRAYAQAASQLSEIDRAQAEALQGQYQATSCPICLESFKSATVGSDDLPIKLLRCGHVFDESCWSEWVSSGQGNVSKCPICKMDVGHSRDETLVRVSAPSPASHEAPTTHDTIDEHDQAIIRRFQQERNFRLIRLGTRYPNFISQSQIQRWSSPTYDGSLVRDPVFQQRSPQEVLRQSRSDRMNSSSGFSSRPMTFGGGTSSGGRAGRF